MTIHLWPIYVWWISYFYAFSFICQTLLLKRFDLGTYLTKNGTAWCLYTFIEFSLSVELFCSKNVWQWNNLEFIGNWNTFILVWKLHKKSHFTLRAKLDFRLANNHHHPLHDQVFNFLHNVVDQSCGSGSVFWLLCIYGQTFLLVEVIRPVQHFNSKKKVWKFSNYKCEQMLEIWKSRKLENLRILKKI